MKRKNTLMMSTLIAMTVLLVFGGVAYSAEVELFGNVTLVEGYALKNFTGCHALISLRDTPGKTIAVITSEQRLQSLLETALATGKLVAFWGQKLPNPPLPRGGKWGVDVYSTSGVILYK
jgi:hypothetical protein